MSSMRRLRRRALPRSVGPRRDGAPDLRGPGRTPLLAVLSGEGGHRAEPEGGVDVAFGVRLEAVGHAPEDGLRAAVDADLPVGRSDVGLHRVDAEVRAVGDLLVAQTLGDERQDLGLAW